MKAKHITAKQRGRLFEPVSAVERRRYNAVDLTKFILSLMVVMIHVHPFGIGKSRADINFLFMAVLPRIAVPFFFVISGFLLYKKTTLNGFSLKPTKTYLLKLLRLYLIWSVIYFPCRFNGVFRAKDGVLNGIKRYVRDLFLGSYIHLWYLAATIAAVLVISLLIKAGMKPRGVMVIATCLYAVALLFQSWYGLIRPFVEQNAELKSFLQAAQRILLTTRKGIFTSMIFVGIGMIFAFYKVRLSQRAAFAGFCVSMALMIFEAYFVKYMKLAREDDIYIMLVPATFFLVSLVLHADLPDKKIYGTLRTMSTLIYFTHLWIKNFVYDAMRSIGFKDTPLRFVIIVAITLLVSYLIMKLSEIKFFKWLKYLYN